MAKEIYSLNPKLSMTTPCPVKLASPCNCTHITLSPNLQSFGEFLSSAYCLARVLPRATGLMASTSDGLSWILMKKAENSPRCEGLGRRDTFTGVDAPSYESEGDAAWEIQLIIFCRARETKVLTQVTQHVTFGTQIIWNFRPPFYFME